MDIFCSIQYGNIHRSIKEVHRQGSRVSATDKRWCRYKTMGCLWNCIYNQKRENYLTNFFSYHRSKEQKWGCCLCGQQQPQTCLYSPEMWLFFLFISYCIIFEFIHYPCPSASITHPLTAPCPQPHTDIRTQTQKLRCTSLPANRLSVWVLLGCLRCWHLCVLSIDFVALS